MTSVKNIVLWSGFLACLSLSSQHTAIFHQKTRFLRRWNAKCYPENHTYLKPNDEFQLPMIIKHRQWNVPHGKGWNLQRWSILSRVGQCSQTMNKGRRHSKKVCSIQIWSHFTSVDEKVRRNLHSAHSWVSNADVLGGLNDIVNLAWIIIQLSRPAWLGHTQLSRLYFLTKRLHAPLQRRLTSWLIAPLRYVGVIPITH